MAELRAIANRPDVGLVRAPASEKPRRFVSTSADGRSGFWTSKSDEELAADEAAAKAQHDAMIAQSLRWHASVAAQAVAEREAAQQAAFDERWPNPREQLRAAHAQLREVDGVLAKHRNQAGAARAHLIEREDALGRAEQEVETVRREQTARLRAQLAGNGGAASDGADDPVETAAMRDGERARRLLVVAQAAQADIAIEVENAAAAVRRAQAQVEACALAVITKAQRSVEGELTVARQRVADLQTQLTALRIDTRYSAAHWRPNLRRLLLDPEAPLIEDEIKIDPAPEPETA
jgi:hypothetical protein